MFEELKKKMMKAVTAGSILMIIVGIAMIIFMGKYAYYGIVGYKVFEELEPDEIGGQLVDVTLTLNFDYYLEEYERNSNTGSRRSTYYYYLILTGNEYSEDVRFMTIKVPASYSSKMKEMYQNTAEGYYSEPLYFSGSIRKLNSEDYSYFKRSFTAGEDGLSEEEFEAVTLPYYIQVITSKPSMTGLGIVISAFGIFLIIFGIVRICRAANGAQLKKFRDTIAAAGYTENMVESDYNAAQSFTKKGDIKVGRLFIYDTTIGSRPTAIPNNKILWAYQTTTTHRTNGIKTGTTYNVTIFADGYKSSFSLSVPNEATAIAILDKIVNTLPWVVVGYSDQISKLFHKDRAQFLSLRYNTIEHVAVDGPVTLNTASTNNTASLEQNNNPSTEESKQ